MSRRHEDVLQNIESALISPAQQDPTIDDRMIEEVLQISINRTEPHNGTDSRFVRLWKGLQAIRAMREDVAEDIWISCLRTVDESVQRHSELVPGETSYLDFVSRHMIYG